MLIDTHCHLDYLEQMGNNLDDIMTRAINSNVTKIITISTNISKFDNIARIAQKYPNIFCSIGNHPDNASGCNFDINYVIAKCLDKNNKIVGIGETGIDLYHKTMPSIQEQIASFEKHAYVSQVTNIPLIIHSRNAEEETKYVIKSTSSNLGVMHCFGGSISFLKFCLDAGLYISISGIITFKNAEGLINILRYIPKDRILIETDAPFLSPFPMRGRTNEPSFIRYVANCVGEILKINNDEVSQMTTANAEKLFKI